MHWVFGDWTYIFPGTLLVKNIKELLHLLIIITITFIETFKTTKVSS
jgi:hypothetical protein